MLTFPPRGMWHTAGLAQTRPGSRAVHRHLVCLMPSLRSSPVETVDVRFAFSVGELSSDLPSAVLEKRELNKT